MWLWRWHAHLPWVACTSDARGMAAGASCTAFPLAAFISVLWREHSADKGRVDPTLSRSRRSVSVQRIYVGSDGTGVVRGG